MNNKIRDKIKNIIEHNGDLSGYALQDEINNLLALQITEIKDLITKEISEVHKNGESTSRLTSLWNKI